MIGGMFAGTEESPGDVELYQGGSYKAYRGMGSLGAMAQAHGSSDRYFQDTTTSSRSWCRKASRAASLQGQPGRDPAPAVGRPARRHGLHRQRQHREMRTRPQFVRITSAGVRESHVHDVTITKEAPNYRIG
jgi:IMP dehydrogenase